MSHYPGSHWRPVAYRGLHARKPAKAALLHTNGGGAQLYGWWQQQAAQGKHIGAQYQVFRDGSSECYVDPDLVVYHAYGASEWAIGIETEDDSQPGTPWTAAQIQTIAAICHFHGVPAVMLGGDGQGNGVGYHQQHQSWNQSGHDCPGHVRVDQIPAVLRALAKANGSPAVSTPSGASGGPSQTSNSHPGTTTPGGDSVTPEDRTAIVNDVVSQMRQELLLLAQWVSGKTNGTFNAGTVKADPPK